MKGIVSPRRSFKAPAAAWIVWVFFCPHSNSTDFINIYTAYQWLLLAVLLCCCVSDSRTLSLFTPFHSIHPILSTAVYLFPGLSFCFYRCLSFVLLCFSCPIPSVRPSSSPGLSFAVLHTDCHWLCHWLSCWMRLDRYELLSKSLWLLSLSLSLSLSISHRLWLTIIIFVCEFFL